MTYWFAGRLYVGAQDKGDQDKGGQNENTQNKGDQITLAANDPALAYGASVFTTLRIYGQSLGHPLTAWDWHCDRIAQSLKAFHWPQPDWQHITQGCQALMTSYPVLRLTILADGRELITGRPLPKNLKQQQATGVTVWVAPAPQYQRSLPGHKTGNYLPCWLAMQTANTHGARDAILATAAGEWLETSTGNLWGYQNGRWWTPPLESGLLPGIRRAQLVKILKTQAITDTPWTVDLAKTFECLAYSNCVVGIMPIHTVLLGNIKLNYSSTHEGLSYLRQMFDRSSLCEHNC